MEANPHPFSPTRWVGMDAANKLKGGGVVTPRFASPSTTSSSLNSLFRVLCNFPSRYLFAIDLSLEYLALDGIYHPY